MAGAWYIQRQKSRALGPFSTADIVDGISASQIPTDSVICKSGTSDWLPLTTIDEFRSAIAQRNAALSGSAAQAFAQATQTSDRPAPPSSREDIFTERIVVQPLLAALRGLDGGPPQTAPTQPLTSAAASEAAAAPTQGVDSHRSTARASSANTVNPPRASGNARSIAGLLIGGSLFFFAVAELVVALKPTASESFVFQTFRLLRPGVGGDGAFHLVVSASLIVGAFLMYTNPAIGRALLRASAAVMLPAALAFFVLEVNAFVSSPAWSIVAPNTRHALVAGTLCRLLGSATCGTILLRLTSLPAQPGSRPRSITPALCLLQGLLAAASAGATYLLISNR